MDYLKTATALRIKLKLFFGLETSSHLIEDLGKAYNKGLCHTDASLISETGAAFKCHRFMLASRSPVFAAMLANEAMVEAQTGQILIKDMSSETIQNFIMYLYTDNVEDDGVSLDLLMMAEKYDMTMLKKECESRLCETVGPENCVSAYVHGYLLNCQSLKDAGYAKLKEHFKTNVQDSESWKAMKKDYPDVLQEIVERLVQEVIKKDGPQPEFRRILRSRNIF